MVAKRQPPSVTINNISAHQSKVLDEAEREHFKSQEAFGRENRQAMGLVAKTIAPKFWDKALQAGLVTPEGPTIQISGTDLAAEIISEYFELPDRYYERGLKDGRAEVAREAAAAAEIQAAHRDWQTTEAALRAENAQLQAQLATAQAQLAAAQAEIARQAAVAARQAATRPTPEKWQPDWPEAESSTPEVDAVADEDEAASASEAAGFVPAAPENVWPEWLRQWIAAPSFNHARRWVEILGQTGEPLRSRVSDEFAARLRITAGSGGERRAVDDLFRRGLVQDITAHLGKRPYGLVSLTDRGIEAYQMLYGVPPVAQHYPQLLARHKAPDHILLILLTEWVLTIVSANFNRQIEMDSQNYIRRQSMA